MSAQIRSDNFKLWTVLGIVGAILIAVGIGGYLFLKEENNNTPTVQVDENKWHENVTNVFPEETYSNPSNPAITDVEIENKDPNVYYGYPVYLFNGADYASGDKTVNDELYKSTLTNRKNMLVSADKIIESIFLPGKTSDVFTQYFPNDEYSNELKECIPTEAQKKQFKDVVITEKVLRMDLAKDSTYMLLNLVGTMKYKGVPTEFQYVLELTTKDGTLESTEWVTENAFVVNYNENGAQLINEAK